MELYCHVRRTIARFTIVRLIYCSYFVLTIARAYEYDRSCLRKRSLVLTIARAYDRSCLRSLVLTIARAYDRSCLRSLVLTIARAYDRSCLRLLMLTIARAYDRSCLRSLVLTVARAYGRSLVRTIVHTIDDRSIVLSIPLFDTTLVFVNTFNDVYSVVLLTVCTMKCILSLNSPYLGLKNTPQTCP